MFLCSPASGTGWQWAETVVEVSKFNKRKSTFREWLTRVKNASAGMLGSNKAYLKFNIQFFINCNKGYGVADPARLMTHHIYAKPINRTNLSLLFHTGLQYLPDPGFKITITYGDDNIYGDSPKYVRERYPTADVITIPGSSHFPWLHNGQVFFNVLADHYSI